MTQGAFSQIEAQWTSGASVLLLTCLGPVFGAISDRVGRKPVIWAGFIWLTVTAYPAFALASNGTVGHGRAFNLAAAIFGGTTPLVATALVDLRLSRRPRVLAIGIALTLGVTGLLLTPETRHLSLRHPLLGDKNDANEARTRVRSLDADAH